MSGNSIWGATESSGAYEFKDDGNGVRTSSNSTNTYKFNWVIANDSITLKAVNSDPKKYAIQTSEKKKQVWYTVIEFPASTGVGSVQSTITLTKK